MRPEEIRRHGTALLERVRVQVDTERHLERILRQKRRRRTLQVALAAAAVIALLVGITLFRPVEAPPVVTEPEPTTTTIPELRSLPVEMFLVVADYIVDEGTGECAGSGELSGVVEGSRVSVIDDLSGDEVESIVLPAGREITRAADPAFLFTSDRDALCLFIDGLEVDHFDFSLFPESDPNVGVSGTRSGQRVVVLYGA